ncbi:restriction endonuclease [Streptomyces sp. NPDC087532]|uniref:restriction endonuclease n=1 Tax=Streptomyces sp. NPDC087532 TaxID=3365795 RepID=UPI003829EDD0
MTGTEFEELVASLCRRDGRTEVRRVGGADDNGADVAGRLTVGRCCLRQGGRRTQLSRGPCRLGRGGRPGTGRNASPS